MELLGKIDAAIKNATEELINLTTKLVNIKSVQSEPVPGGPFGLGIKQVLDFMLEKGRNDGFCCEDHKIGVATLALKPGTPDLGIWLHADVVPEGSGWKYDPYNATLYKGCIIGRGTNDNKGQLAAIYLLLKIFKDLKISLNYNPALYLGSCEENGMADMVGDPNIPEAVGFLNVCTPPALSLVPDSGFPVGYGGKGALNITLRSKTPLHGLHIIAGTTEAPGRATVTFEKDIFPVALPGCTREDNRIIADTPPVHGAHPDPNGNMITVISEALLPYADPQDRYIFEFLQEISKDIHGEGLGIAAESEYMPPLTVFAKSLSTENGLISVNLNIRYPYGVTTDELEEKIASNIASRDFEIALSKPGTPAYLLDPNAEVVQILCDAANSVTGENAKPYALSGATYAHRLPNAYPFGTSAGQKPDDFPKGRGGAHGVDECVSVERLKRAMRIYARALLALEKLNLK